MEVLQRADNSEDSDSTELAEVQPATATIKKDVEVADLVEKKAHKAQKGTMNGREFFAFFCGYSGFHEALKPVLSCLIRSSSSQR